MQICVKASSKVKECNYGQRDKKGKRFRGD